MMTCVWRLFVRRWQDGSDIEPQCERSASVRHRSAARRRGRARRRRSPARSQCKHALALKRTWTDTDAPLATVDTRVTQYKWRYGTHPNVRAQE